MQGEVKTGSDWGWNYLSFFRFYRVQHQVGLLYRHTSSDEKSPRNRSGLTDFLCCVKQKFYEPIYMIKNRKTILSVRLMGEMLEWRSPAPLWSSCCWEWRTNEPGWCGLLQPLWSPQNILCGCFAPERHS